MSAVKIVRGRYQLPDPRTPDDPEPKLWTRVSTLASVLDDTYNLDRWKERQIVKGLSRRSDLYELAKATPPDDKRRLDSIVRDAANVMAGDSGANLGTAFHSWTERHDRGQALMEAGPETLRRLQLYSESLEAAGITINRSLMERVVFNTDFDVVGRLDRAAHYQDDLVVCDLKTQKDPPGQWDSIRLGIQQSCYNHASFMWDETADKWHLCAPMNKGVALIIWMPIGEMFCEIFTVDTARGYELARLAYETRQTRRTASTAGMVASIGRWIPAPRDWAADFTSTTTVLSLNRLGRECLAAGEMTDELKAVAKAHRATLEGSQVESA